MDKKKILIVDDDESITRLVKLNLERVGNYEVATETLAERAFPAVRKFRPDVIILDVMMPGLDGGDIAIQIRDHEETCNIPVIFLTAAITEAEEKSRALEDGYTYLHKPVDIDRLVQILEAELGSGEPEK